MSVAVPLPVQVHVRLPLPRRHGAAGARLRVRRAVRPAQRRRRRHRRARATLPAGALKDVLDVARRGAPGSRRRSSTSRLGLRPLPGAPASATARAAVPTASASRAVGVTQRASPAEDAAAASAAWMAAGAEPPGRPRRAQLRRASSRRCRQRRRLACAVADLARDDTRGTRCCAAARGEGRSCGSRSERVMRCAGGARPVTRGGRRSRLATEQAAGRGRRSRPASASSAFAPFLLHGVTGSGKTEVYFRAAERALAAGRGVAASWCRRSRSRRSWCARRWRASATRSRSCTASCRWASATTSGGASARARAAWSWARARRCSRPSPDLGLIVRGRGARGRLQAGREPALPRPRRGGDARAQLEGAWWCSARRRRRSSRTTTRAQGQVPAARRCRSAHRRHGPAARSTIVDRRAGAEGGRRPDPDPAAARGARRRGCDRKEQALLLLNRRGYATSLLCRECGMQADCPNCSVLLTLHQGGARALCHYCGFEMPAPRRLRRLQGRVPAAHRLRHGEGRWRRCGPRCRTARVERLDRDLAARRGARREGAGAPSRRARPTSWWARR